MTEERYGGDYVEESILDVDTSDAVEPVAVEPGEYEVRITGFRKDNEGRIVREAASGNRYFIITFDIPSEFASKGFSQVFSVPNPDIMDSKQLNSAKWNLEVFKQAFGLTEINFANMIGKTGYAILKKKVTEEYGEQTEVAKFSVGQTESPY